MERRTDSFTVVAAEEECLGRLSWGYGRSGRIEPRAIGEGGGTQGSFEKENDDAKRVTGANEGFLEERAQANVGGDRGSSERWRVFDEVDGSLGGGETTAG